MTTRVALVTGASRGIGAEVSKTLVESGFLVIGVARSLDTLLTSAAAKSELFEARVCDVTSEAAVVGMMKDIENRHSHLDLLINSAGIGFVEPLIETSLDHWTRTIDVNLTGSFLMTRMAVPLLRKSDRAHIFNMASVAGRKGFRGWGAYCASKFGLLGMTEVWREELRSEGIKVTAIIAGATDTPFWDTVNVDFDRSRMIPAGDVAGSILHAYSQSVNSFVEELVLKPARGDF